MQNSALLFFDRGLQQETKKLSLQLGFNIEDENTIEVNPDYSLNKLLRIINKHECTQKGTYCLLLNLKEYDWLSLPAITTLKGVQYSGLKITRNNIVQGAVDGFYAYLKKREKKQKEQRSTLIYESPSIDYEPGNYQKVVDLEWIKPGTFRSTYILGPQLTAIRNKLIDHYKKRVIVDYKQIVIPKITSQQLFAKSNHIRLPEHAYLISKFQPSSLNKKQLYGHVFKQWRIQKQEVRTSGVSTYGVCEPFWSYYENSSNITDFKYYDYSGFSLRNEGNAIKGLQRLDVFSRIQLIFGYKNPQDIITHIKHYVEKMKSFLNQIGLHYRILQVQSWTPSCASINNTTTKNVKTYDFEVYLAYKQQWLEVANISNNGQIFSKAFKVTSNAKTYLYTGCAGIGIERLLYSAIEQKGYKHIEDAF